MATSGTTSWAADVGDIVVEAFERIGVRAASLSSAQLSNATRSLNFILKAAPNRVSQTWKITTGTLTASADTQETAAPSGTVSIMHLSRRTSDGTDTPLAQVSDEEWHLLTDKDESGEPNLFYVDRDRASVTIRTWPVQSESTTLYYTLLSYIEDVTRLGEDVDYPVRWHDWLAGELAYRLGLKYRSELQLSSGFLSLLKGEAEQLFNWASAEDANKTPTRLRPDASSYVPR